MIGTQFAYRNTHTHTHTVIHIRRILCKSFGPVLSVYANGNRVCITYTADKNRAPNLPVKLLRHVTRSKLTRTYSASCYYYLLWRMEKSYN